MTAVRATPPDGVLAPPPVALPGRIRGTVTFLGPAFVAGIAYVDPGNVATNVEAGVRFGYTLLWVVVVANLVAVLMQWLSAKLGVATGRSLAQVSGARASRPGRLLLWLQAEVVALATDLAEIVGGALALALLAGVPLPIGAMITAAAAYALLMVRDRGNRRFEVVVLVLFGVIAIGIGAGVGAAGPDLGGMASGLVPGFSGADSVVLAAAMVGATVMPHALYLHSALTPGRLPVSDELGPKRAMRLLGLDVGVALGAAGVVNAAMVVLAASMPSAATDIEGFHSSLAAGLGGAVAFAFAAGLLASGLASSGVGTLAGEVVMTGFLRRRVPRPVRRLVTVVPSVLVLMTGVSPTDALICSQLVLALGVPVALVLLVRATADRDLMGAFANRRWTTVLATVGAAAITAVDAVAVAVVVTG